MTAFSLPAMPSLSGYLDGLDRTLLLATLAIATIGLVMICSASMAYSCASPSRGGNGMLAVIFSATSGGRPSIIGV